MFYLYAAVINFKYRRAAWCLVFGSNAPSTFYLGEVSALNV